MEEPLHHVEAGTRRGTQERDWEAAVNETGKNLGDWGGPIKGHKLHVTKPSGHFPDTSSYLAAANPVVAPSLKHSLPSAALTQPPFAFQPPLQARVSQGLVFSALLKLYSLT